MLCVCTDNLMDLTAFQASALPPLLLLLPLRHIIRQKSRGKMWDNQHDKVEMCHLPVSFCFTVDPDLLEPLD